MFPEAFSLPNATFRPAARRPADMLPGSGNGRFQNARPCLVKWVVTSNWAELPLQIKEFMTPSDAGKEHVIERRQQVEQTRLANEEQYHALADAMPQIVWTARPDGTLDYYNQRWLDYTGTTLDETQGRGWEMLLHPDDYPKSNDKWTEALRTGETFETEYRFKRAFDGVYRWHLARAVPVMMPAGKFSSGSERVPTLRKKSAKLKPSRRAPLLSRPQMTLLSAKTWKA